MYELGWFLQHNMVGRWIFTKKDIWVRISNSKSHLAWFIQLTQKEQSPAHFTHSSERTTDVPARVASSEAATGDRTTTRKTGGVLDRETPCTTASSSSHASKWRWADAMVSAPLLTEDTEPILKVIAIELVPRLGEEQRPTFKDSASSDVHL
jgi:hypothetical protein